MTKLVFLFGLIAFGSCKPSAIRKELSGSDSLVIRFASGHTVATTESKAIRRLIRFVDAGTCEMENCAAEGEMQFFREEKPHQSVSFSFRREDCRCFQISVDGELRRTRLSREAADFLTSLEAGRSWY